MEDILLRLDKDPRYRKLLASIDANDKDDFVKSVEDLGSIMNLICASFDDLLATEEGQDKFLNEVGGAINRRSFYNNNGVTEIPWPEKS